MPNKALHLTWHSFGWMFSLLYIYVSFASAYEWISPKEGMYCATPLLSAITFLLFPLGIVMGAIIYRDYRSLKNSHETTPTWLETVKISRMLLGGLAVTAVAVIALPIFIHELS